MRSHQQLILTLQAHQQQLMADHDVTEEERRLIQEGYLLVAYHGTHLKSVASLSEKLIPAHAGKITGSALGPGFSTTPHYDMALGFAGNAVQVGECPASPKSPKKPERDQFEKQDEYELAMQQYHLALKDFMKVIEPFHQKRNQFVDAHPELRVVVRVYVKDFDQLIGKSFGDANKCPKPSAQDCDEYDYFYAIMPGGSADGKDFEVKFNFRAYDKVKVVYSPQHRFNGMLPTRALFINYEHDNTSSPLVYPIGFVRDQQRHHPITSRLKHPFQGNFFNQARLNQDNRKPFNQTAYVPSASVAPIVLPSNRFTSSVAPSSTTTNTYFGQRVFRNLLIFPTVRKTDSMEEEAGQQAIKLMPPPS